VVLANLGSCVRDVVWKPYSSRWNFHLLREEFLSDLIHSPPPLWLPDRSFNLPPRSAPQAALYWPTTLDYKSVSIYPSRLQYGRLIRTALNCLECLDLHSKLSSYPWAHMSGRAGPTDRSAGLLAGRPRLSGTAERPCSVGTQGYPCLS
jgi:hypothetical protein